jgi:hypothetical protein
VTRLKQCKNDARNSFLLTRIDFCAVAVTGDCCSRLTGCQATDAPAKSELVTGNKIPRCWTVEDGGGLGFCGSSSRIGSLDRIGV